MHATQVLQQTAVMLHALYKAQRQRRVAHTACMLRLRRAACLDAYHHTAAGQVAVRVMTSTQVSNQLNAVYAL
jgi:hypothetical protein